MRRLRRGLTDLALAVLALAAILLTIVATGYHHGG